MNFSEIRKKLPEYNNLSDEEFFDKFHQKYYSDIPKDELMQKVEYNPNNKVNNIFQDISELPQDVYNYGKRLVEETPDFLRQSPERAFKKVGQTIAEDTRGLFNLPANIQKSLLAQTNRPIFDNLQQQKVYESLTNSMMLPSIPEKNIGKQLGVEGEEKGDFISQNLGIIASSPELIAKGGLGLLEKFAARFAEGGLYGSAISPQNARKIGLTAAILPLAGEGREIGGNIAQGARNVAKGTKELPYTLGAKAFRGTATPEQLRENAEIAGELPINIGQITKSPIAAKSYENYLAEMLLSGSEKAYEDITKGIQHEANSILDDLSGGHVNKDPNELSFDLVKQGLEYVRNIKNSKYQHGDAQAEKEGFELDSLPTFEKHVNNTYETLNESPLLKTDSDVKNFFNKLGLLKSPIHIKESPILDASGRKISTRIYPKVWEVNSIASKLYDYGTQKINASNDPIDRTIGLAHIKLSKLLRNDVKNNISRKGSQELKDRYDIADDYYENVFAKYLDKGIQKFLNPDKNKDAFAREIINPSVKYDKFSTIKKIQSMLPPSKRNLLGYAFLQNAINKSNELPITAISKELSTLGKRQFKHLFEDEKVRKRLLDFTKLQAMSSEPLSMMYNPKTGAKNVTKNVPINSILAVGSALAGTLATGHIGGLAAATAPFLAGAKLSRFMTNPEARAKLIEKMIENDQKKLKK